MPRKITLPNTFYINTRTIKISIDLSTIPDHILIEALRFGLTTTLHNSIVAAKYKSKTPEEAIHNRLQELRTHWRKP